MPKHTRVCRSAFVLLAILGLGSGIHAQLPGSTGILPSPPRFDKLDPLLQQAALQPIGQSLVIVRAIDGVSLNAVALLIQQAGGTLGRRLPIIEAQAANVANSALLPLAGHPLVQRIAQDRRVGGTMERTGPTIGSTAARQEFGYDGTGIGVAVIDSGVTAWHDDLSDGPGSQRVDQFVDFVNDRVAAYDDFGHGTHVSGIIAGNGFDSGGARSGIAPGVRLIELKVLDDGGRGKMSDVIAAFDYIVSHQAVQNIRVVNVSVGAAVTESYNADFLTLAAKRAVDAGIVVVAAAGNRGRYNGHTQYGGIAAPGNAPWVLTVGASSHQGTIDRSDDTIAPFSSRGPTAVDYSAKPDIVAPGVGIESLSDPASSMYATRSAYLLNGTVATSYLPYLSLSGTSQATPVVAGTVALMLQADPGLTPNGVKAILQYTSQVYAGYNALTQGAGFLNAYGAIELSRYFADPTVSPYPTGTDWSHQLIWGNHRVPGGVILPDADAWSTGVVWGDSRHNSENIAWGLVWSPASNETGGAWTTWGTSCADPNCQIVEWGSSGSENVVWGSTCGGGDCANATTPGVWSTSDDDAVVWGTTGDDAIVWGTTDEDAVVWGTSCTETSCS